MKKNNIEMERKNLTLRYFGLIVFLIGIILNIKMYLNQEWPTYLFYIICFVGIIQILVSIIFKNLKMKWQLFWSLIPFVLGLILVILYQ